MADLSDVEDGLVAAIYAALYPTATPPSVLAIPVKIYAGWPDPATLQADLKPTGNASPPSGPPSALHVSVYPRPQERNVTRYARRWAVQSRQPHTYGLSLAGLVLTVSGAAPSPFYAHNIAVLVNGRPYVYQTLAAQTPSDVAAGLQALIGQGTTVVGPAVTFPAGTRLGYAREGTGGTTRREVSRQERQFQVGIWADRPANRNAIAKLIKPALDAADFLTLSDGSRARIAYHGSAEIDADQKQGIYRRDLIYTLEYATLQVSSTPEIVVADLNLYDFASGTLIYTNDPATPAFSPSLDLSDGRNSFAIPNF